MSNFGDTRHKCVDCGEQLRFADEICPRCHREDSSPAPVARVQDSSGRCPECNEIAPPGANFCNSCGAALVAAAFGRRENTGRPGPYGSSSSHGDPYGGPVPSGFDTPPGYYGSAGRYDPPPADRRYFDPVHSRVHADDAPSTGMFILGFFIPIAGLLIWAFQNGTWPERSKSAVSGAIVGLVLGFLVNAVLVASR